MLMVIAYLIVVGVCLGSFVNALIWRLHEQDRLLTKSKLTAGEQAELKRLSIGKGRSMCLSCGHELAARDLIPVLSWLWLRGRCRYCKVRIPDTPLAELGVPALFVLSWLCWPWQLTGLALWLTFVIWLACLVAFVALALYDARWYLLSDRIVFPLIGLALIYRGLLSWQAGAGWLSTVMAGLWGAVVLWGLFYAIYRLSDGRWIGFGDVKLAIALGLLGGGPLMALLLLFLASVAGTLASVPLLLAGKSVRQARIPFGPFLLGATVLTVLFGSTILQWYTRLLTGV